MYFLDVFTSYGFVDDMEHSMALIFLSLGLKAPFSVHEHSQNINTLPRNAPTGGVSLTTFRKELGYLNTRDMKLYSEARKHYDDAKEKAQEKIK